MTHFGPFSIEARPDGVAVLWLGVADASVNVLRRDFADDLSAALDALEARASLAGVVLASRKPDSFIAGADVHMLREVTTAEEATAIVSAGQEALRRLADFHPPVVAAIHGSCLGGGLEVAMACAARVATDSDDTRLGQPEVRLGLIPGLGGTQRLPSLVGLEEALSLILAGGRIPAERALEIGLVDEVVHPAVLVEAAVELARRLADQQPLGWWDRVRAMLPADLRELLLEDNFAGRALLFRQAEQRLRSRASPDVLPAPYAALACVQASVGSGDGFAEEAKAFGRLAVSPSARNLLGLFVDRQALGGERVVDVEPPPLAQVGVLGAGLMGSGIALVTADEAGLPVRLRDLDQAALRSGLKAIRRPLQRKVDKGRMGARERDRVLARVLTTTEPTGFRRADVVIEAVVEDLPIKREVLRQIEATGTDAVLASNTSSLPIAKIAEGAVRPERVVGMHYFSPVDRVPLLEVVRAPTTGPEAVAAAVALGRGQGKTVIVVEDGPGFYTSRILAPYVDEANRWIERGVAIEDVDAALTGFGFPVGPLQLVDEVGIDVAAEIAQVLEEAFGERMAGSPVASAMIGDDRRGRKSGRGFYAYEGGEREGPDPEVYALLDAPSEPEDPPDTVEIAERCVLAMANEAVRCVDEGIVRSARDADVGAVFGLGFPPWTGGPLRWLDARGLGRAVAELQRLEASHGPRFTPAAGLLRAREEGAPLHPT